VNDHHPKQIIDPQFSSLKAIPPLPEAIRLPLFLQNESAKSFEYHI
jgi:hypothetical protein